MSVATDTTKLTVLVDNKASGALAAEHGFSVLIETAGRRLLFDAGQGPALAMNAAKLNVVLGMVDTLVLSHGHYDHTGGMPLVVESAPAVHVYCHRSVVTSRYSIRDGVAKAIDMPKASRAVLGGLCAEQLHWVTQPALLMPGVGLTGPVPRRTDYEDTGGHFFIDAEGKHGDPIDDDLSLWIRTKKGLVAIVGCSHAGVINILQYARELSRTSRIHAVLGGFHLGEASEARLSRTVDALAELGPDLIVPCHCTGDRATSQLTQAFGERVCPGTVGATFTFGSPRETIQET